MHNAGTNPGSLNARLRCVVACDTNGSINYGSNVSSGNLVNYDMRNEI